MDLFLLRFLWVAMGQDRLQFSKCGEKQQIWVCVCVCVWIHHALSQSFIQAGSCLMPNKIFWNFNYFWQCARVCLCVCASRGQCNTRRLTASKQQPTVPHSVTADSRRRRRRCRHVLQRFLRCSRKGCEAGENPEIEPSLRAWLTK